jgi:RNA polymerase sigma-70 factor (ECF subfamily)
MESTSASLLERLRQPGQEEAWGRFVDLYAPLMRSWARAPRYGLSAAEADDAVTGVLADLARKLPALPDDPDRPFRAWLRGVVQGRCADRRWGSGLPPAPEGDSVPGDLEERRLLARRALELMKGDLDPGSWAACWGTLAEGRPAAEVAAELGVTEGTVYVNRGRVLRRLRQEFGALLD